MRDGGRIMKWIGAWFWSRVRDNENWAQTLARVLGNLFRITLTVVLLGVGTISVSGHLENQRYRREQEQTQLIAVTASLRTEQNDNGCAEMFPLALLVRNDSAQALISMDVMLSARRPGTSTNVLDYGHREIRWDHVIPPGYSMTMCYMPPDSAPPSAVFSADPRSYTMVLRPTEQWMIEETNATRSRWQVVH
jgi:hypothetical protein